MKQQLHILQFIRSARLFQLSPSSRSRHRFCWRTATSTHFWSSTIIIPVYYISQRSNSKNCFRITGLQRHDSKASTENNTCILPRNQSPSVSNSQRGQSCEQIFDSLTTFLNPLVRTNSLYGKQTVIFFSLASHAVWVCEAHTLHAHKTFMPRFPISLLILRKKLTGLCSLQFLGETVDTFLTDVERGWRCRVI